MYTDSTHNGHWINYRDHPVMVAVIVNAYYGPLMASIEKLKGTIYEQRKPIKLWSLVWYECAVVMQ